MQSQENIQESKIKFLQRLAQRIEKQGQQRQSGQVSQTQTIINSNNKVIINGFYSFVVSFDDVKYAMTIQNESIENEAYIVLEPYTKKSHQKFYLHYDPYDGYYVILSYHSIKSIGVQQKHSDPGILIVQSQISFESNYKWKIYQYENDEYQFEVKSNKMRLSFDEMKIVDDEYDYNNDFSLSLQQNESKWLSFTLEKHAIGYKNDEKR